MLADPQKFTSRKHCHRASFRDLLNSAYMKGNVSFGVFEGICGTTKRKFSFRKRCCRERFRDLLDSVYYEREIVSLTKNERKIQK